jgi:hypothetical protein
MHALRPGGRPALTNGNAYFVFARYALQALRLLASNAQTNLCATASNGSWPHREGG